MENNPNQSVNPETATPSDQHPIKNQRSPLPIILGIIVILIAVGVAYYLGTQKTNQNSQQTTTPIPTITEQTNTELSPTSVPTTSMNKSDWKTYTGKNYTFAYPPDWQQTGPEEYLETVQLINPKKTVSITISKGPYPYGFGAEIKSTINTITININGKTIEAKEIVSADGAFVDFAVGEYHILYGTNYPAVGTKASLTDYNTSKETISEILSSFKLTQ